MMKEVMKKKVLIPRNCGLNLRSQKESIQIIKEQLEQLRLQGEGQSRLAKMYMAMLNAKEAR